MRIGRYAPAYDRNVGRGEVSSGFGTMYTNKVKNNSHENIQAWLFFSGWYASLRSYLSISEQFVIWPVFQCFPLYLFRDKKGNVFRSAYGELAVIRSVCKRGIMKNNYCKLMNLKTATFLA